VLKVRSPETDLEWADYYELRWRILRAPWGQPRGSERDEFEDVAIHRMACTAEGRVVAVGRLHNVDQGTAQIRYMATDKEYINKGFGTLILKALEQAALASGTNTIVLHAREVALPFYQRHGYRRVEASHRLYGEIQHHRMIKGL
jgi:GNAT superfamily N-acetyltransferase